MDKNKNKTVVDSFFSRDNNLLILSEDNGSYVVEIRPIQSRPVPIIYTELILRAKKAFNLTKEAMLLNFKEG